MEKYRAVFDLTRKQGFILKGTKAEIKKQWKKYQGLSCRNATFDILRKAEIFLANQGNITEEKVDKIYKQEQNQNKDKIEIKARIKLNEEEVNVEELKKMRSKTKLNIYLNKQAIYCDAGEISKTQKAIKITNSSKNSILYTLQENNEEYKLLLDFLDSKGWKISKDCIFLNENSNMDIQYAEAIAMYFALEIAIRNKVKILYSDCESVIKVWSNGIGSIKSSDELELVYSLYHKKKEFEKLGGEVRHIYGDINPADLGKHKKPSNCSFVTELENHINIEEYGRYKKISDKIDNKNQLSKRDENDFIELIKKMKGEE